jgi:lipoate-protein ligase A
MGEDTLNKKIPESYGFLCQPIIEALDILGIKSEFKPINDILANGKKISGSAQTRKWGAVLQHGTLMYSTNIDELFSVLNVSKAKIADKILDSIKDRVTTVKKEIGEISRKEVESAMIEGYRRVFGELEEGKLTAEELEMAKELRENKYATNEWLNQK